VSRFEPILVGKNVQEFFLLPQMANRHGLIAGATGTGKTVTLQRLAEGFSRIGVPVFMADVKGDLSGVSQAGGSNPKVAERVQKLAIDGFNYAGCPVTFWDVFGEQGHPVRATISEMGPLLMSRLLNLNDTQSGVLSLVFKVADDQGLLLLDLKDLRSMLTYVADNAKDLKTTYGNVSAASIGAIQRGLLALEEQGGERFFGEPALDLEDLMQTDARGQGVINILAADRLMQAPQLYTTFLLWLMAELFERLPEAGDLEKPKLVFFFDEAHLLFDDASKVLLTKVEQVARLIRSKGVGIYFISQNPLDIPEDVLGQLGNRVQHALRAFTPKDQKAVRSAAETFRPNPDLDVEQAITELGVGEALISFLDEGGIPGVVERTFIVPPGSKIGPIQPEERQRIIQSSLIYGHYEKMVDRESAFELLQRRLEKPAAPDPVIQPRADASYTRRTLPAEYPQPAPRRYQDAPSGWPQAGPAGYPTAPPRATGPGSRGGRQPDTLGEAMMKSAVRAAGSQLGRSLLRGVLGSLLGGGRR
jgi:DNA helicase HerA-like ATPase